MNKRIKIIIISILLFILSGCSIDINLTINNKYEVKENSSFLIPNDIILLSNNSVDDYLNDLIISYSASDYKLKKITDNDNSGINFSLGYTDINDYIEKSNYYSLFSNAYIYLENKTLEFETIDGNYEALFEESPDPLAPELEAININIKFYNEVVENNADSYDEKNNTYTWIITKESQPDSIYFKTSKKIRYDIMIKDMIAKYLIYAIILGGIVILTIFGFVIAKKKIDSNNEI